MKSEWFLILRAPNGKELFFVNHRGSFALVADPMNANKFESKMEALNFLSIFIGANPDSNIVRELFVGERVFYEVH